MVRSDSPRIEPRRRLLKAVGISCLLPWHRHALSAEPDVMTMQAAWLNDAESAGYLTAMSHGLYAQEGIALNYLAGGPMVDPISAVIDGTADLAIARLEGVARAIAQSSVPLRIIGAQYQKSPLGIVTLAHKRIEYPGDLVGRRVSVSPSNLVYMQWLLDRYGIDETLVDIISGTMDEAAVMHRGFDPGVLINDECDACIDLTTKLPYRLNLAGADAASLLLYDTGYTSFDNVIVTTAPILEHRPDALARWMRASRLGWQTNFRDPVAAIDDLMGVYIENTVPVHERERFYNQGQIPLMESADGLFAMNDASIAASVEALSWLGHAITETHFDVSVLRAIEQSDSVINPVATPAVAPASHSPSDPGLVPVNSPAASPTASPISKPDTYTDSG